MKVSRASIITYFSLLIFLSASALLSAQLSDHADLSGSSLDFPIVGIESSNHDNRDGKILSSGCIIARSANGDFYVLTVEHAVPSENSKNEIVVSHLQLDDVDSGSRKYEATVAFRYSKLSNEMSLLLDEFEKLYEHSFYPVEAKSHPKSNEFARTYARLKLELDELRGSTSIDETKRGFLTLSKLLSSLMGFTKDINYVGQIVSLNLGIAPEEHFKRFNDMNKSLSRDFDSLVNESSVFTEIAILKFSAENLDFESVEFGPLESASCSSLYVGSFYPQKEIEYRKANRDDQKRLLVRAEPGNSGGPIFCDDLLIGIVSTVRELEDGKTSVSFVSSESIYEVLKGSQLAWLMGAFSTGNEDSVTNDVTAFERVSAAYEASHVLLISEKPFNKLLKPRVSRLYLRQSLDLSVFDDEGRSWFVSAGKRKSDRVDGSVISYDYSMRLGCGVENGKTYLALSLVGTRNGESFSEEELLPLLEGETQTVNVYPELFDIKLEKIAGGSL